MILIPELPFDRVLATRFGYHAAELVKAGRFGRMVALQGYFCTAGRTRSVPLDHELLQAARGLGVMPGDS